MGWIVALVGFFLVGLGLVIWGLQEHNGLITLDERVQNATAQVAAQAESRWDALISLSNAVSQYSTHEAETLEKIIAKRQPVGPSASKKQIDKDDIMYEQAKVNIQAVSEQYPDLKADGLYQSLMSDINSYETNIRESRMIFNDTVTKFNRRIRMFPSVIIANMNGYSAYDYFQSSETKRDHPLAQQKGV